MATFFGEILPVVSRAIDEDEFVEASSKIYWKKTSSLAENDLKSDVLIFIKCSNIVKKCDSLEVGEICQKYSDEEEEKCVGKIYEKTLTSTNIFIVVIDEYVSINNAWEV